MTGGVDNLPPGDTASASGSAQCAQQTFRAGAT